MLPNFTEIAYLTLVLNKLFYQENVWLFQRVFFQNVRQYPGWEK